MAESTCTVERCERRARIRGLCHMHAARLRRLGTTELPPKKPRQTVQCSVDECDRVAASKGMCKVHYLRVLRLGTTELPVLPPLSALCVVPGCERSIKVKRKQMCALHYARDHKYGDPLYVKGNHFDDKTGQRFGLLTAVERIPKPVNSWLCVCDCGNYTTVLAGNLSRGSHVRCGDGKHNWQDAVSYAALHHRIKTHKGPAREHRCIDCGEPAAQWSYDHADPNELFSTLAVPAGYRIPYSTDLDHYDPRCGSCHTVFDITYRKAM